LENGLKENIIVVGRKGGFGGQIMCEIRTLKNKVRYEIEAFRDKCDLLGSSKGEGKFIDDLILKLIHLISQATREEDLREIEKDKELINIICKHLGEQAYGIEILLADAIRKYYCTKLQRT